MLKQKCVWQKVAGNMEEQLPAQRAPPHAVFLAAAAAADDDDDDV